MKAPLTREEVSRHSTEDNLWIIIDHKIYDVSDFIDAHPGGSVVLAQVAGQDATQAFYNLHRHEVLQQYASLCIGAVEGEKPEVVDPQPGELSRVPYAEPLWLTPQFKSPYYNDSHRRLQKAMRVFVDEHVTPEAKEREKDGKYISQELIDKMAETNILATRLGPGKHLHGRKILGDVMDGKDFDYFHDLVVSQELTRHNQRGFQDGNMAGMTISLTAVRQWCNDDELRERVTEEVLSGKKKMCLAITEAFAGSDVAGLRTTAELSEDGSHYVVNGTKKWIVRFRSHRFRYVLWIANDSQTNGMFSDYFVVGCKTKKGFTVLLVERSDQVETKLIKTSYSTAAATTYIEFNNVKVPRNHLLGQEDKGFIVIMSNFNHVSIQLRLVDDFVACQGLMVDNLLGTLDDGLRSHPLDAHRAGRVSQMVTPACRLRQAACITARHPAEARPYDHARGGNPGLARANYVSDEPAFVRGSGKTLVRPHWAAEELLHEVCGGGGK